MKYKQYGLLTLYELANIQNTTNIYKKQALCY